MKLEEEMPVATFVDLQPDRNLLDPKFNGYKLSLDPLPTYSMRLKYGVDKVGPEDDQYSIQHAQLFANHNFLHFDPWNPSTFYLVDARWNVCKITFNTSSLEVDKFDEPIECWKIPSQLLRLPGRYNVTLKFPDEQTAIISDGCGNLFIIDTGNRSNTSSWKEEKQITFKDLKANLDQFALLDSVKYTQNDESKIIDAIIVRIRDKNDENLTNFLDSHESQFIKTCPNHPFVTTIDWITVRKDTLGEWNLSSTRTLVGPSGVNYASIESNGNGIVVASENHYAFIHVSDQPLKYTIKKRSSLPNLDDEEKKPDFLWMQNTSELVLWFRIPIGARKSDLDIKVKANSISCSISGKVMLEGDLFHVVKEDETVWTITSACALPLPDSEETDQPKTYKCLEIILRKSEQSKIWESESVVKGDSSGKQIIDPEIITGIHGRLEYLCSDKWDSDSTRTEIFDGQQLEECDSFPSDTTSIMRIDRNLQCITHIASLGSHQWLFSSKTKSDELPVICVRHDVDGLVWQPKNHLELQENNSGTWKLEHVGTFSAMGYVQASKQQRRFTVCPADFSYAAICDSVKHVYIYRQPTPIATDLRNRRTGERVSHVAKQQVVSIEPPLETLGAFAAKEFLFILTTENIHAIRTKLETAI